MTANKILLYICYFLFIGISLLLILIFVEGRVNQIGFISILIATISIIVVFASEKLVNTIAQANFLRVISQIEDRRLELDELEFRRNLRTGNIVLREKLFTKRQINSWKCQVLVEEAIGLIENSTIESRHIRRFLNLVNNYIQRAYVVQYNLIRPQILVEEINHILTIYSRINNLETNNILTRRTLNECRFEERIEISNNFIRLITNIGQNVEINQEFLDTYKSIISNFLAQSQTQQILHNLRFNLFYMRVRAIFNSQYRDF